VRLVFDLIVRGGEGAMRDGQIVMRVQGAWLLNIETLVV
jgi:hypothetical protein